MKKKYIGKIAGLVIAVIGMATSANAALLLTTTGPDGTGIDNPYVLPGGNVTDAQIIAALNAITPGLNLVTLPGYTPLQYKATPGGADEGSMGAFYNVTYVPVGEPESATITFVGGNSFDTSKLTWLLAKDGVSSYVWNLTGIWNGIDQIQINNLWPGAGSFSHIQMGGTPVPEPATVVAGLLLLLPFGASTIRILRKNRAA